MTKPAETKPAKPAETKPAETKGYLAGVVASEGNPELKTKSAETKSPKAKNVQALSLTGTIDSGNKDAMSQIVLAKTDDDPSWDPKMLLPVPPALINGLALYGWDVSMPLKAIVDPSDATKLKIVNGRTKFRAVEEANKRRKANKLPPIVIPYVVAEGLDEFDAMRVGVRLNAHQQHRDPITVAQEIERLLSAGFTEADSAEDAGLSVKEVNEHLSLLRLPAKVQALVQKGKMTPTAALGLVHLDAKQVEAAADRLAALGESAGRVTKKDVEKEAAPGAVAADRLNAKQVKLLIEELKAATPGNKMGKCAQAAAVAALETVLDARKRNKLEEKLHAISSEV